MRQITPTKYRDEATGLLLTKDEDKRTWSISTADGQPALYTRTAMRRRFRKFDIAMQHAMALVNRMTAA